jgi:SAM-dependent methyltransferase
MGEAVNSQTLLLKRAFHLQVKMHETVRMMGNVENQTCLDVGFDNAAISQWLRGRGGVWHSLVMTQAALDMVKPLLPEQVQLLEQEKLPYGKETFDVIVLSSVLERMSNDERFIEECHRVLKPDGRLIIHAAHTKGMSLIEPLRKSAGLTFRTLGWKRPGYTESQLFQVLRHGFDVQSVRTYQRFFVELVRILVESSARSGSSEPSALQDRLCKGYRMGGLFQRLAYQFDMFLFATRGFCLVAEAKRRGWRERNAPVLSDGRSISEAVLSKTF